MSAVAAQDAELQRVIRVAKEQLLVTLVRLAGGKVVVPVTELDANGGQVLVMELDQERRAFVLEIRSRL